MNALARIKVSLSTLLVGVACVLSAGSEYSHLGVLELTDQQEVSDVKINSSGQVMITLISRSIGPDGDTYQSYFYDPVTGLTALPGANVQATDINEEGMLTGTIRAAHQAQFFTYHPKSGMKTDLETGYTTAQDINDRGMVAGWALTTERIEHKGELFAVTRAFLYVPNSGFVKPDILGEGFHRTQVIALNDRGMLSGFSDHVAGMRHAFRYQPGHGTVDLGSIGTLGEVRAMNGSGTVIADWGGSSIDLPLDVPSHYGIIITADNKRIDLDTLGLGNSEVIAINDSDLVVGRVMNDEGIDQAFAANTDGHLAFLPLIPEQMSMRSVAFDLNNANLIIGAVESSYALSESEQHNLYHKLILRWEPVIWTNTQTTAILLKPKDSPDFRGMPLAVNEKGQVVVLGLENGESENLKIFVLEPITPSGE